MSLSAPEPLADHHRIDNFLSCIASLDDWLKRRARANQTSGASRTYVVCDGDSVVGYYALASGSVNAATTSGNFRRNMPDPVPVVVLGRLAIDRSRQGQGLGRALFQDCVMRVNQAAEILGIRGILVHAISEEAKAFYIAIGFDPSPLEPMTLMIKLADIKQLISNRQVPPGPISNAAPQKTGFGAGLTTED